MTKTFLIEGMTCQHCIMAVKKEIQKLDVQNINVKIGEATIDFDEKKLSEQLIIDAIEEAGYTFVG